MPQKIKQKITIRSRSSTSGYISKKLKAETQTVTYQCSSSVIHNSQEVETAQVSIKG